MERIKRRLEEPTPEARWEATAEQRHMARTAAYVVANQARHLAHQLADEAPAAQAPEKQAPAWPPQPDADQTRARHTHAAMEVLEAARQLLAAAVQADRATGTSWSVIGQALGVSADTAARHYRST